MVSETDRIERERAYHNARFTHEVRDSQSKYYYAIMLGSWAFEKRVHKLAEGGDILEYGCGDATQSFALAPKARGVTGIDISDVAVAKANKGAADKKIDNLSFQVMDAENMTFPDDSFDLVFGRGIIHHLDIEKSYETLARVTRPGGKVLLWEPLGHNPVLGLYRALTPASRTPDEHPLLKRDLDTARKYFDDVNLKFCGLTTLASVPFRDKKLGRMLLNTLEAIDQLLFKIPGMRYTAWHVALELGKPKA